MCEQFVGTLKPALLTLSNKFPFTPTLNDTIERNFKLLSSREAYETLRYLITLCGKCGELNSNAFSEGRWKSVDPEIKKKVEKSKNYVFDTIKELRKENKISIPPLKKSDLLVPGRAVFFTSCLSFVSYALSYQLTLCGIYYWPSMIPSHSAYLNMKGLLLNSIEEKNSFQSQQLNLLREIESLESAIFKIKEKKVEVNLLLETEINKCKYKRYLKEEPRRSEMVARWKDEIDALHERNLQRIQLLEDLVKNLSLLNRLMDRKEEHIINGEELANNIPLEVENFAELNGLALRSGNCLNLPALFKTVHLSIPKTTKSKEVIQGLFAIKPPEINTDLLQKLEIKKTKLEERCKAFHENSDENVKAKATSWLEGFFTTVPKVNFTPQNTFVPSRDLIFDEKKLLRFCQLDAKNSVHKMVDSNMKKNKGKELFRSFTNIKKSPKTKVGDVLRGVRRDSKKSMVIKRKSISLKSLSSLSPVSIKSLNSGKVDSLSEDESSPRGLCSTPKENLHWSFISDRNISPISIRDKSGRSQKMVVENSPMNSSILTENDVRGPLLNSYMSDNSGSKTDKMQGTFDLTASMLDISFDSTPSQHSINVTL